MHIQVTKILKSYGGQDVLKDISFAINSGEKVALLGKNGSGKSTLFKILMGEEVPDDGHIAFNPKTAQIGYLPQVAEDDAPMSSGEKLKKKFQEILISKPDVLILDEPTNHLDWQGMAWLEREIMAFSGPVLIVSHDRNFLDKTVNKILELDNGEIKSYGGNYTFYKQQKQVEQEAHVEAYSRQQNEIAKLQKVLIAKRNKVEKGQTNASPPRDNDKFANFFFTNRVGRIFGRQIQALENRIDSIEKIDKPQTDWKLKALFKPKQESGQTVVQIKSINYKNIFGNISLVVQKGQRIALIGDNGSGKSTLLKLILGEIKPDSGEIIIGNNVQIGYLSQEHQELNSERIVLDELESENIDKTESYKLLRRFLLSPEKINQPVKLLSSGEKAKLLLAKIMTSGANFIILDEPTNHLAIPSREAIEESLSNYSGTLLTISHDRYFLDRLGITDYYEIQEGGIIKV